MIKQYIEKISESKDTNKMNRLGDMLEELIYALKDVKHDEYEAFRDELYELAYGKKISEEMAKKWVNSMKPVGQYWTMEQTTSVLQGSGYNLNPIDFYVTSNMMMNDYNNLTKEDEELAIEMAYDWLNDVDAKENKLYCYWKHIVKR